MERPQFIYFIEPARPDMPSTPTDEEIAAVTRHFKYLKDANNLILAGRTLDAPFVGIAIFEADDASDARYFAENDPAVIAGVFVLKSVQPYQVALVRT